jgi:hypothetical protein
LRSAIPPRRNGESLRDPSSEGASATRDPPSGRIRPGVPGLL